MFNIIIKNLDSVKYYQSLRSSKYYNEGLFTIRSNGYRKCSVTFKNVLIRFDNEILEVIISKDCAVQFPWNEFEKFEVTKGV